jgi:hypothetical protein
MKQFINFRLKYFNKIVKKTENLNYSSLRTEAGVVFCNEAIYCTATNKNLIDVKIAFLKITCRFFEYRFH